MLEHLEGDLLLGRQVIRVGIQLQRHRLRVLVLLHHVHEAVELDIGLVVGASSHSDHKAEEDGECGDGRRDLLAPAKTPDRRYREIQGGHAGKDDLDECTKRLVGPATEDQGRRRLLLDRGDLRVLRQRGLGNVHRGVRHLRSLPCS